MLALIKRQIYVIRNNRESLISDCSISDSYLPFDEDISGFASSESFLIATAFLILFIALPPTFALLAKLGLLWLDDTKSEREK